MNRTTIPDDVPTAVVPQVGPGPLPGRARGVLPWVGFGVVAVAVVAGASLWSTTLRAPHAPPVATLVEASAPVAPPSVAPPSTVVKAPASVPAATARGAAPPVGRRAARPSVVRPAAPARGAAPVAAPTPAPPTTAAARNPFGPGYTPGCAATPNDPACRPVAGPAARPAAPAGG